MKLDDLNQRVSAARKETEARGETFYPGPSRIHVAAFPPKERWDDWVELDSRAWPERRERRYMLVPTTCFNCESACGLLAYVDKETLGVQKFEGNPEHPGSRGRNCAKGPATLNQVTDPDRILFPLKRVGGRGEGKWVQTSWDEALDDIAARIRKAIEEGRHNEVMYHVGRPGEDGFTERILASWGVDGHNSHTNICSSSARAGYQFWMGLDRPSPDHAIARVILLISSHLESGHYFNPHAQRVMDAKAEGAGFTSTSGRSAAWGNSGGGQVARALFLLTALRGAVAPEGGVFRNAWNKFVPKPIYTPPHPPRWNELTWPREYPLAMNELSFLLPHFLKDGRGHLDVYFTRVYNPVWTNPDGFSWIEALQDESAIGCYVALTPTWNETAYFADYVLPMGHGSERHDIHSYETHDSQWLGFRQPVLRAARERQGQPVKAHPQVNPGEDWEENEFWLELTWRIDPDGALGIRKFAESQKSPSQNSFSSQTSPGFTSRV